MSGIDIGSMDFREFTNLRGAIRNKTVRGNPLIKSQLFFFLKEAFWKYQISNSKNDITSLKNFIKLDSQLAISNVISENSNIKRLNIQEYFIGFEGEIFFGEIDTARVKIIYSFECMNNDKRTLIMTKDIFTVERNINKLYEGFTCKNCGDLTNKEGKCNSCGTENFNSNYEGWFITNIESDVDYVLGE